MSYTDSTFLCCMHYQSEKDNEDCNPTYKLTQFQTALLELEIYPRATTKGPKYPAECL